MSLSTWFREYVYIPLGGNRRGRARQYLNLGIVWALTGFWHGASWNFLFWGIYFAVILILEKAFLLNLLDHTPRPLRHFYAMLLVVVGFLIFHFSDVSQMRTFLLGLIGIGCRSFSDPVVRYQLLRLIPLLIVAVIGSTPYPKRIIERLIAKMPHFAAFYPTFTLIALLLCVSYLVDSTFSPFAYLQF